MSSRAPRGISWSSSWSFSEPLMEFLGCLSSATLCSGGVSPARGAARVGDGAGAGPCSQVVSPERDRRPCHPGTPCQAGLVLPIPSQPAPAVLGKRRQPVSNPKVDSTTMGWPRALGEEPPYLSRRGIHPRSSSPHPPCACTFVCLRAPAPEQRPPAQGVPGGCRSARGPSLRPG